MFNVGDLIIYGNSGVCRVESIGPSQLEGADSSKDYYCLAPYYSSNSRIYTPCDNEKIVMRAIISRDEAECLIDDIASIGLMTIEDEKNRENIYKSVIRRCDARELVSILKTIHERKQVRLSEGKKVTANDEKYFNLAEDKLHGELAVALGIAKDRIKEYIRVRLEA